MAYYLIWEPAAHRPAQAVSAATPREAAAEYGRINFPPGEHVTEVYVTDSEGRQTRWTLSTEMTVRAQLLFEAPP